MEAQDDLEAQVVFEQAQHHAGADLDLHLFSDPKEVQEREVNVFQTTSTVVLQKSLRECFGLTVTEAMWKGNAVIRGNCGGIRVQIEDGRSGFLVKTPRNAHPGSSGLFAKMEFEPEWARLQRNRFESSTSFPISCVITCN